VLGEDEKPSFVPPSQTFVVQCSSPGKNNHNNSNNNNDNDVPPRLKKKGERNKNPRDKTHPKKESVSEKTRKIKYAHGDEAHKINLGDKTESPPVRGSELQAQSCRGWGFYPFVRSFVRSEGSFGGFDRLTVASGFGVDY
jgi:hypothetical protein